MNATQFNACRFADWLDAYAKADGAVALSGLGSSEGGRVAVYEDASLGRAYLGRYRRGQVVPLQVLCYGPDMTPRPPDRAPVAHVYSSAGIVESAELSQADPLGEEGLFLSRLPIGHRYSLGRYSVVYVYVSGDYEGVAVDHFEVIPGGDQNGGVISLHAFDRPESQYVVAQLDSGKLIRGRNPRL